MPPTPVVNHPGVPAPGVFVPTSFTPNGDGKNDFVFVMDYFNNLHTFNWSIYNRAGEKVFETSDKSRGWDGTFNGLPLNTQVLVYQIKGSMPDGQPILMSGDITLQIGRAHV